MAKLWRKLKWLVFFWDTVYVLLLVNIALLCFNLLSELQPDLWW